MKLLLIPVAALLVGATPPPKKLVPKLQCDSAGHMVPSAKIIVQGGISPRPSDGGSMLAIGPKQDDPSPPKPDSAGARSGLTIAGGTGDPAALGPKQDDPGPPPSPDMTGCQKAPVG
ncbi:MAG: hypothetical protein ABIQ32_09530 [Sphingomicrobium sp.]